MSRFVLLTLFALLAALVFAPAAVAQMDEQQMNDDQQMSSPMASESAMEDEMMSASPSATGTASRLPGTGGVPLVPLLSVGALALIVSSGIVMATLVRRNS
jgi:hypothetical protein